MESIRRAVIDVGTNSIKLLVADVTGQQVVPVCEMSRQTRLGKGFYGTRQLQAEPIARSAQAVAEFAAKAQEQQARSIRVIATSAAREAVNAGELVSAIQQAGRLSVEILSGEREAELGFQGVTTDPALAREPLLMLDIGGGSTQIILGKDGHAHFRESLPLGTVRLLELLPFHDPPAPEELAACRRWLRDFLRREARPTLEPALRREGWGLDRPEEVTLVGVGGTASILGCMELSLTAFDRQRLERARLSLERLRWHLDKLWSLPLETRQKVIGLPANRADVVLPGAAIYEAIMEEFGFTELRISTRGLRFAAVMDRTLDRMGSAPGTNHIR